MKTVLYIVRHAEAEGNINRLFHGWTDSEITPKGHKQAEKIAQRLKDVHIDVIYSSSLKRALQTAEYIAKVKNLPIIRTDKLKEINGGDWEGECWEDLAEKWPECYNTWEYKPHEHKMPNGESMVEFQKRIIDELMYIIRNNEGKNICIVTHGTAIKAVMCHFRSCPLEEMPYIPWVDNTALSIVEYDDGKFNVIEPGDASHLDISLSTIRNQEWYDEDLRRISKKDNDNSRNMIGREEV